MRELSQAESGLVGGGWWQVVVAAAVTAAWAWENRADLMEVGDAAMAKNAKLNSEH
jgi:hypothetical protein